MLCYNFQVHGSNFMNHLLIAIKEPYGIAPKVQGLDEASRSNDIFVMSRT